jgi:hypothetical protein
MMVAKATCAPYDKYNIVTQRDATIPIPPELQVIHDMVLAGAYNPEKQKRISYLKQHGTQLDSTSPMQRDKGCKCKNGKCTNSCGCKRRGNLCCNGCSCNENCY